MQSLNVETRFGTLVYAVNYTSNEYWKWAKSQAKKVITAVPEDSSDQDYVLWLEGRVEKPNNSEDQERFQDLIIANKMLNEGTPDKYQWLYEGLWSTWKEHIKSARQGESEKRKPIFLRGLDNDLFDQARERAIKQDMNIANWLNEAIQDKLSLNNDLYLRARAQANRENTIFGDWLIEAIEEKLARSQVGNKHIGVGK